MAVSSGDYSQGPVPTVFVEMSPPPPPPKPREEEKGGLTISKGFLGALVVLLLGAAIAGTGFFYYQYAQTKDLVAARDKTITEQTAALAARDKAIGEQKTVLAARDKAIGDLTLQYGQIEKLKADAAALHKNAEEVLARRPGTAGIPDRLKQAPPWREAAEQTLAKYVAALQKEFTRIDKPVVVAPDTTPDRPRITPSGGSGN
jgi:cell division protein FtsI/penicillin-binding protein 2